MLYDIVFIVFFISVFIRMSFWFYKNEVKPYCEEKIKQKIKKLK